MDDKGYIEEATVIKAAQQSERQPYDVVRQALKEVELDSSRRVELDDYVDVSYGTAVESILSLTRLCISKGQKSILWLTLMLAHI